jgi:hypothetical protein
MNMEVAQLRLENQTLEADNEALRQEVKVLKGYIDTLMMESSRIMEERHQQHRRGSPNNRIIKLTEKRALCLAKSLYYKDLKQDAQVLEDLKINLVRAGLLAPDAKHTPLHIVKCVSDQRFNALSQDIKLRYKVLAEQEFDKRNAEINKHALHDGAHIAC